MSETNVNSAVRVAAPPSGHSEYSEMIGPILFFDGVCGFCNRSVDWLLSHDTQEQFRFAPLQGETAEVLLKPTGIDPKSLNSVVLLNGGKATRRSRAVVDVLWKLGGGWSLLGTALWLVPFPLRDLGYEIIASVRYRIFGKSESCRMPKPGEASRFLP